ncbi:DNA primase, partial [Enterobacter bugandensis]|nr:DNA primase [Enterobacter bugandensis]
MEIDGKYEKQFSTLITAVVLATNNEPMSFTERQGGIARRRVIFAFNHPVKEADKDPLIGEKIAAELPVVIRCLLAEFADQDNARKLLLEQRDSREAMGIKR